MDFQSYIDGFFAMSCIVSVEKKGEGERGDIRIVAGNRKFIEMVECPPFMTDPNIPIPKFEPDSIYSKYLPKTPDFEEKCYQAAVLKRTVHTYIHLNVVDLWFNMFFCPMDYEDDERAYCAYSSESINVDDIDVSSSSSSNISNEVLKICIKLRGNNNFKNAINEVIHDIRELCEAETCSLLLVNEEEGTTSILANSISKDSTVNHDVAPINMFDMAMSWLDTVGERDSIIIRNDKDMEYIKEVNNPWYNSLKSANIYNLVLFPLRHNGELLGFIWATNFDVNRAEMIKETLEVSTFFISSEIAGYVMLKQLEHISYTDLLTGILNRNAMNNRVTDIVDDESVIKKPYGIIFADLNGLKRINDKCGHQAGDLLLRKAGLVLQEVFPDDEVYRAGGDEFMVIVFKPTKEQFDKKVEELRKMASDPDNVCFSVGSIFNDTNMDIRDAMKYADEAMYKDKEEYYTAHPERKYR